MNDDVPHLLFGTHLGNLKQYYSALQQLNERGGLPVESYTDADFKTHYTPTEYHMPDDKLVLTPVPVKPNYFITKLAWAAFIGVLLGSLVTRLVIML